MKIAAILLTILVVAALGALALLLHQPNWLVAQLARHSPRVLYFVDTEEPVIALTIDDGPDPRTTPRLLDLLARHDARATFFLISDRVGPHEDLVASIVDAGHEIGNHLTKDEPSISMAPAEFEASLMEADSVLSRFAPPRFARPGSGWYSDTLLAILEAHGYRCALGSIYPYDATIPSSEFSAALILRKARPGSIIILHDGGARGERTLDALKIVLPELNRRGLRVVSLSQLVDHTSTFDFTPAPALRGSKGR